MTSRERLKEIFRRLTGREPTDGDIQHLWNVKDALQIRDNDALWEMIIAFQHYLVKCQEIPPQIEQAAKAVMADTRTTAEMVAKEAFATARADLASAVATTAQQVASDVAGTKRSRWVMMATMAIVLGAAVVAGGWLYAYVKGRDDMEATLRAQQPALTWLASRAGQRARELSDQGIIEWVDSFDGYKARQFSREGLIVWLESDAGKRAREFSAEGVFEWLDSPRGQLAREFSASGSTQWLASEPGQRAREFSEDGTLEWVTSREGERARQLSADGTIGVLETEIGRRLIDAARKGAGSHFVNMMDCRPTDKNLSWFVSQDRAWCEADGRTRWPYLPAR